MLVIIKPDSSQVLNHFCQIPRAHPVSSFAIDSKGIVRSGQPTHADSPFVLYDGIPIAFVDHVPGENPEVVHDEREFHTCLAAAVGIVAGQIIAGVIVVGLSLLTSCRNDAGSTGAETRVKSTLHLETFVLNLADTDQRSYLRVGIDLGLSTEPSRNPGGPPVAAVRDTILGVLAQGKVDDLLSAGGKARLKENLLHALQERLPDLGVQEVYFTEFLVQR